MNALKGIKVVDLSVNAPGPFASKMLADLGAEVINIVRPNMRAPEYAGLADDPMMAARGGVHDALSFGKTLKELNLTTLDGHEKAIDLIEHADVLISEMRPGKLESLGLEYEMLSGRNRRLILCHITGYGRTDPRAHCASHDINYLALSGALSLCRDANDKPVIPQNIVADYAAGGSFASSAILAALFQREKTGRGAELVISMTDGVRYLIADITAATLLAGADPESWRPMLTGGMPTYDTYATRDGKWLAVGALEPKFIAEIARVLEWEQLCDLMSDQAGWPQARAGLTTRFRTRTRDAWSTIFADTDACVTPVLTIDETSGDGRLRFGDVIGVAGFNA